MFELEDLRVITVAMETSSPAIESTAVNAELMCIKTSKIYLSRSFEAALLA